MARRGVEIRSFRDGGLARAEGWRFQVNSQIPARRFFARPTGSSERFGFWFGTAGIHIPQPFVVTLAGVTILREISHCLTVWARRSESPMLHLASPIPSE